ncbi:hypothetical protein RRG08_005948 [Elysia crispata]|uniref:Uncharacterized protein n=1 Tax=Elysia crispata TaxID=231223 RepID=A0AAE0ZKS5_9GAST|nr:hypothetical protein RRG08_005948 [Elysia crispata]
MTAHGEDRDPTRTAVSEAEKLPWLMTFYIDHTLLHHYWVLASLHAGIKTDRHGVFLTDHWAMFNTNSWFMKAVSAFRHSTVTRSAATEQTPVTRRTVVSCMHNTLTPTRSELHNHSTSEQHTTAITSRHNWSPVNSWCVDIVHTYRRDFTLYQDFTHPVDQTRHG